MKYALLIYTEEAKDPQPDSPEGQQLFKEYFEYTNRITEQGINKGGEALLPTATATTVRVRDDEVLTTDGPFAETKEQLGGFYLIEAEDLDTALVAAAAIPGAKHGSIEVRPIIEFE